MFLNIRIDLLILKTYYGHFTLTTKKIIAYHLNSVNQSNLDITISHEQLEQSR